MSILWRTGPFTLTTGSNWTPKSVRKFLYHQSKNNADLSPLFINGHELEVVQNDKLLGVTITNNLSWNLHINETVKKASKRLYFVRQLKRARVPTSADLVRFYTCIRSVYDYAVPVFHSSLPSYLINDLEWIQKRALSIIFPHLCYSCETRKFKHFDSNKFLKDLNQMPRGHVDLYSDSKWLHVAWIEKNVSHLCRQTRIT